MKIGNYETHEYADIFPMIQTDELSNLKSDIKEHGLLQPIILFENKILDGRNRYRAITELGLEPKFEEYKGDKPLEYVISLNLKRRHLTQSQAGVIALDVLPKLEEEARKRIPRTTDNRALEKLPKQEFHSSKEAGKLFNVSEKYVREAKKLKETNPELLEQVRLGHKNFSQIKKEQRTQKIEEQKEQIKKEKVKRTENKEYDIIVIDPPWKYGRDYNPESSRVASPYPEQTQEQIKESFRKNVKPSENSIFFLWTTHAFIQDAFELFKEWGVNYKGILVWDKEKMGMGSWLRMQCEFCLMGTKGKPLWDIHDFRDIIRESRTTHSKKPKIFYELIDSYFPEKTYNKLDFYARTKKTGWDVWGDEV